MAVDPWEKGRIWLAALAYDFFIALFDDSLQSSVQGVLIMDVEVLIQEYEVIVSIDIGLTLDLQISLSFFSFINASWIISIISTFLFPAGVFVSLPLRGK